LVNTVTTSLINDSKITTDTMRCPAVGVLLNGQQSCPITR